MLKLMQFLAVAIALGGCATPKQVARLEGKGSREVFPAPFDQVWRAAVDAAQIGELEIYQANREAGYIDARRGIQLETFGENIGIWVKSLEPNRTQVEVLSRQAGPPVLWLKNWQDEVLRTIAANLTRETPSRTVVGGEALTPVPRLGAPPPSVLSVPPVVETDRDRVRHAIQDERRQLDRLRVLRQEQEAALAAEADAIKRESIERELEVLREQLEKQERRLKELDREP